MNNPEDNFDTSGFANQDNDESGYRSDQAIETSDDPNLVDPEDDDSSYRGSGLVSGASNIIGEAVSYATGAFTQRSLLGTFKAEEETSGLKKQVAYKGEPKRGGDKEVGLSMTRRGLLQGLATGGGLGYVAGTLEPSQSENGNGGSGGAGTGNETVTETRTETGTEVRTETGTEDGAGTGGTPTESTEAFVYDDEVDRLYLADDGTVFAIDANGDDGSMEGIRHPVNDYPLNEPLSGLYDDLTTQGREEIDMTQISENYPSDWAGTAIEVRRDEITGYDVESTSIEEGWAAYDDMADESDWEDVMDAESGTFRMPYQEGN